MNGRLRMRIRLGPLTQDEVHLTWVKGSRAQIWCGQEVKTESKILTPVTAICTTPICVPPLPTAVHHKRHVQALHNFNDINEKFQLAAVKFFIATPTRCQ